MKKYAENNLDRGWALLFARLVLGLIFFMAGVFKVFQMGPLEHARKFFLPFSLTVVIALVASLVVALTLVPVLVSFFLERMPRAERDPAVAAASILARAEFLRRLDQLSREAGVRLPKGASSQVDAVARALVAQRGPEALNAIAKTHFKTTQKVT